MFFIFCNVSSDEKFILTQCVKLKGCTASWCSRKLSNCWGRRNRRVEFGRYYFAWIYEACTVDLDDAVFRVIAQPCSYIWNKKILYLELKGSIPKHCLRLSILVVCFNMRITFISEIEQKRQSWNGKNKSESAATNLLIQIRVNQVHKRDACCFHVIHTRYNAAWIVMKEYCGTWLYNWQASGLSTVLLAHT